MCIYIIVFLGLYRIPDWPDIQPFYIQYPAGYPVLFAGYLAGRIAGKNLKKSIRSTFFPYIW